MTACSQVNNDQKETVENVEKIEIVYFYSNQRCVFCKNMEKFLENAYEKIKRDKLQLKKINYDDKENKELVEKFSARNLGLYFNIISDNENIIKEDVSVWRYLNDQDEFTDYLEKKTKQWLDN